MTPIHNNSIASGRSMEKFNFGDLGVAGVVGSGGFSLIPDPAHYYLNYKYNKKFTVPKSEMRCLIMLSQGRSAKETGQLLGISQRTVESNIANAKLRLDCNTKSNLLDLVGDWKKYNIWSI